MSRENSDRRTRIRRRAEPATALLVAMLAGALLVACGSGSSKSTSSTTSASASSTAPGGQRGQFAKRTGALRTCLKGYGITLPERKPGRQNGQRPRGPFGTGGGFKLPSGLSRAKLQEAFQKCGGNFAGRRFGARNSQGLAKFATCMRENGIDLPAPNTSGKGPVFDTSKLDTTSAKFKSADAKCMRDLVPAGGAPGGAPGGGPRAGGPAPGANGGAPPGEPPA
jgi:hypothetical protein